MKHYSKITGSTLPMMEDVDAAAYLEDFSVSEDLEKPITCGLFRLEKGNSLTYTYTYHEMKLVIDGEFRISDETGTEVLATTGDLLYFPKGSTITFSTSDYGLGFFCGQRGEGEA